jgi:hypothetical protein
VFFRKTCFKINDPRGPHGKTCRKAVIAGFRPGCITPEEFLNIIKKLIKSEDGEPLFSRVLFVSTAHIRLRFPLLEKEELFIPALIDLFKSERIVSIFIDIEGDGANDDVSYGLASLADYLISLRKLTYKDRSDFVPYLKRSDRAEINEQLGKMRKKLLNEYSDANEGYTWSLMDVENVRGKEYSKSTHALTVTKSEANDNWEHNLHIVNLRRCTSKRRRTYSRYKSEKISCHKGDTSLGEVLEFSKKGLRLRAESNNDHLLSKRQVAIKYDGRDICSALLVPVWWRECEKGKWDVGYALDGADISVGLVSDKEYAR